MQKFNNQLINFEQNVTHRHYKFLTLVFLVKLVIRYTFEKESMGRRERNLHEMRMLEVAIAREIVYNWNY